MGDFIAPLMTLLTSLFRLLHPPVVPPPLGCAQLLSRSRAALRLGKVDLAEAFVMEMGAFALGDPSCLNLLGLIAEARGNWDGARHFWGRAARRDRQYLPARQNIRRHFELFQFGCTTHPVAFGDEPIAARVSL
jgi:hypothetical protein